MPAGHVEELVAKPRVSIIRGTTPLCLGDVVVKMDVDALVVALFGNGIKDLYFTVSIWNVLYTTKLSDL